MSMVSVSHKLFLCCSLSIHCSTQLGKLPV